MISLDEELLRLRGELERLRVEAKRLKIELARRPKALKRRSEAIKRGVAARDLLFAIQDALETGQQKFFSEYRTTEADLLKLVLLCEDDAARAGPLIDIEARWYANAIRKVLVRPFFQHASQHDPVAQGEIQEGESQ
jgi:hypothetical protein